MIKVNLYEIFLSAQDLSGVSGTLTMDKNHNPIKGVVIIKVDQGKFLYQATIQP